MIRELIAMTMVQNLRSLRTNSFVSRTQVAATALAMLLICVTGEHRMFAQHSDVHYLHAGALPPGAIGRKQLERGGPLRGYLQPVEIKAPKGSAISLAKNGQFDMQQTGTRLVGMFLSPMYRLKITRVPGHPGKEVFPTIEIIDRLYPPLGQRRKFPIPIDITEQELNLALSGKFVTRVIYLENARDAIPFPQKDGRAFWREVLPSEDPFAAAEAMGRPVAILRIGSRIPAADGPNEQFMFGSPPWDDLQPVEELPQTRGGNRNSRAVTYRMSAHRTNRK